MYNEWGIIEKVLFCSISGWTLKLVFAFKLFKIFSSGTRRGIYT